MSDSVGLEMLRTVQGASRYARSYAFLYAAFQQANPTQSVIRDAIDCLTPFVAAYTHSIAGHQVELQQLQKFLADHFGFEIPLYALERILPDLKKSGYVEFKAGARIWIALSKEDTFRVAKDEIDTEFEDIQHLLTIYAASLGFTAQPPSGDWGLALINFLKPDSIPANRSVINLKDVLIDARETERKVVAAFIQKMWEEQPTRYEKVIKIFMGVLVEDFLTGISELGDINEKNPLVILYDTTVLLRSLGCSGRLHKAATDELTRYLQDIGCRVCFLSGNESEVNNVISTILSIKDGGGELEGETANAISRGEVSIASLRMLQNNFVEVLAQSNIFEFNEATPAIGSTSFQINELGFAEYLNSEALKRGRSYGHQNRNNDAGYLATVMRLRRGAKSRDFAESRFVFVTANHLLAYASREYLIREKQLTPVQCAPVLHITQVATIAWLLKDRKLSPDLAGRELLVNCFAAARPNAEWFKYFREGIEKVVGDLETFSRDPSNGFILQAARRIAQEQSFSNSSIMRQLNAAELINEARKTAEDREQEVERQHAEREQDLLNQFSQAQQVALEDYRQEMSRREAAATAAAEADARARLEERIHNQAHRQASRIIRILQGSLAALFVISLFADSLDLFRERPWLSLSIKITLGIIAGVHFLDLIGVEFVAERFNLLRDALSQRIEERLRSTFV